MVKEATDITPVWLDADPGFDDWLTMLMLAAQPRLRWLGISVVAGPGVSVLSTVPMGAGMDASA